MCVEAMCVEAMCVEATCFVELEGKDSAVGWLEATRRRGCYEGKDVPKMDRT